MRTCQDLRLVQEVDSLLLFITPCKGTLRSCRTTGRSSTRPPPTSQPLWRGKTCWARSNPTSRTSGTSRAEPWIVCRGRWSTQEILRGKAGFEWFFWFEVCPFWQVDRWADQHCTGDQRKPGQPEGDIEGERKLSFSQYHLKLETWHGIITYDPLLLGCPDQAEWFDKQIPDDQQLSEQDQLSKEAGHHYPWGCDWSVPCLYALVHIWLACWIWKPC